MTVIMMTCVSALASLGGVKSQNVPGPAGEQPLKRTSKNFSTSSTSAHSHLTNHNVPLTLVAPKGGTVQYECWPWSPTSAIGNLDNALCLTFLSSL